ncbi:ABC transporter ATP-binding protein [Candidatus Marinarcus aquaticus]|uniref:ABC transporter ATP-binding protein n=1 Tax=Candidatus Marinarcus aquaticus TaxID=2044504 RepID=A0A4Q0XVA6_9BACT|nr:ABC transporter ATP-binding protein [Candidatus Marinarcus aquaticus]
MLSTHQPLLQAKNISHKFDYPLFNNVDIELNTAQSIAIIGASGSGKSTLLNLLSSLLKPHEGEVIYNDTSLYELKKRELLKIRRDDFGIIFQAHYLFRGFSAQENLEVASLLSGNAINNELLKELNIDFVLHQGVGELSGGQQQRLSIARVLTKQPKVIFADEPTGNLDKATASDVIRNLFYYIKNNQAGMIIVTHENDIAMQCDKVYELVDLELKVIK